MLIVTLPFRLVWKLLMFCLSVVYGVWRWMWYIAFPVFGWMSLRTRRRNREHRELIDAIRENR